MYARAAALPAAALLRPPPPRHLSSPAPPGPPRHPPQASTHRYHHLHCDTPLDPHSPYEGFWWCHMGWILDHKTTLTRVGDRSNVKDIMKDPWYQVRRIGEGRKERQVKGGSAGQLGRFGACPLLVAVLQLAALVRVCVLRAACPPLTHPALCPRCPCAQQFEGSNYMKHIIGMYVAIFLLGFAWGDPIGALVWGGALRTVWVYHITWFVNSATHCWGYQTYNTGG